ncbi:MAG: asparagine synthase (glutamine-hydrolyzing) [Coriobacteriia bacterium]|nr:asparagine synthase (glutamine-hydrolyzing) [Coriobacteriia bacterium]
MCGICGFTQAGEEDMPVLKAMCDVMAHRGPDGEGQFIQDGVALGHRRLSLIDLEGGSQPIVRPDQGFAIVFNGEIYNYQDLRAQLQAEGFAWEFRTDSDTEVLLAAYAAWGRDCLNKLRGMFAFTIWDFEARQLFCARDFFGIKPFYYTVCDGQFIFGSEIKVILEHPAYERKLNREALEQYLCFQFSALDETFFQGIFKLPAGCCMTVGLDGSCDIQRFWGPDYAFDETRSYDETVDAIDAVMRDSVRYHNVADVEVGSFLSSGIDSSYMAACLAQENPDIKTFTVGFAEYSGERDEISWAKELADKLGVQNTSKHITEEEYWASLPTVQWHMDEPSADPSAVALYFVDQIAATQVKAVLSGEGADEFFGGYRIYQTPLANAKLGGVPKGVLHAGSKVLGALHVRGANYLDRASKTPEDWYYTNACGVAFSAEERAALLREPVRSCTPQQLVAPTYAQVAGLDETTRMQYVDLYYWLVGDILLKTDKMSMAHSLESRVPFLDRPVFDLSRTIPTRYKVSDSQTKLALRDASKRAIPQDWAEKEKLGFPVPVVSWLREQRYYEEIKGWFTGPLAQEFFNTDMLVQLLDQHKAGDKDNTRKIWIVYMFLMWYRIYFVDRCKPVRAVD